MQKQLRLVTDWLLEFQKSTAGRPITLEGDVLTASIAELKDIFEKRKETPKDEKVRRGLCQLEAALKGKTIPTVAQHRDLSPSNICLRGNRIALVTDWELSRVDGDPLYDLFYFISFYFFYFLRASLVDKIADFKTLSKFKEKIFFSGRGPIHRAVSRCLVDFCRAAGVDPAVAKFLFLQHEVIKFENVGMLDIFFEKENNFVVNF